MCLSALGQLGLCWFLPVLEFPLLTLPLPYLTLCLPEHTRLSDDLRPAGYTKPPPSCPHLLLALYNWGFVAPLIICSHSTRLPVCSWRQSYLLGRKAACPQLLESVQLFSPWPLGHEQPELVAWGHLLELSMRAWLSLGWSNWARQA